MYWDRVYTIHDYYDGPRFGVADFRGVPHIYDSQFNDAADDHDDVFLLTPIGQDLLKLVLEDWAIWLRWNAAYRGGEVPLESHPALAQDRPRHEELQRLIGGRFATDPATAKRFKAEFRTVGGETQVQWREHDAGDGDRSRSVE